MRKHLNHKGQSTVEAVVILPIILLLIFGTLAVGIYIYDSTVFVYAANKALDHGIGMMIDDGYLSSSERADIRKKAKEATGTAIFVKNITARVSYSRKTLNINVEGDYVVNLPLIKLSKDNKDLKVKASASFKKKR